MMTDKKRIEHAQAMKLAIEACTLIGDVTERIAIAGQMDHPHQLDNT